VSENLLLPCHGMSTQSSIQASTPNPMTHILIDGSNLYIEGQRLSSFQSRPAALREASVYEHQRFDFQFRLDLHRLIGFLRGSASDDPRPKLFGSHSENSPSFFSAAVAAGFELVLFERNAMNREKQVDVALAVEAMDLAARAVPGRDRFVLVAGDGDYLPLVQRLRARGFEVEIVFWGHAARHLVEAASRFVNLDPHAALVSYRTKAPVYGFPTAAAPKREDFPVPSATIRGGDQDGPRPNAASSLSADGDEQTPYGRETRIA
jgi:uncharacterized LabA/DUF88 family protein